MLGWLRHVHVTFIADVEEIIISFTTFYNLWEIGMDFPTFLWDSVTCILHNVVITTIYHPCHMVIDLVLSSRTLLSPLLSDIFSCCSFELTPNYCWDPCPILQFLFYTDVNFALLQTPLPTGTWKNNAFPFCLHYTEWQGNSSAWKRLWKRWKWQKLQKLSSSHAM